MDFISSSKNAGSSAFGSSSNGNGSSAAGGMFSNFFNLSIQKMVLILAVIAFIISIGTVAFLLWKSKSAQKWPPEIAKCPDRMSVSADGNSCVDTYGLAPTVNRTSGADDCGQFSGIKNAKFGVSDLTSVETGYVPWESLKCLT